MQDKMRNSLLIGWAQSDITPDRPVFLRGQFYERISQYVHDPITATALVIDNGLDHIILVSLDMCGITTPILTEVRKRLATEIPDIDVNKISICATHTHTSLCIGGDTLMSMYQSIFNKDIISRIDEPPDIFSCQQVVEFLNEKITKLIYSAWNARKPGGISYATDYAVVAFNRRPIFSNGEAVMYGVCSREDFVKLEGVSDHSADMLYTWDLCGNLTGVAVNIPCPSQVMELHQFIAADYWDPTRNAIRELLGNIYILPLCGASGDQNPIDLIRISKTNVKALGEWSAQVNEVFRNFDMTLECNDIGNRIAEAVKRGYYKARNRIKIDAIIKHKVFDITLPISTVTNEDYMEALSEINYAKKQFTPQNKMKTSDMVPLFKSIGIILRWEQQQQNKAYTFEVHILRLAGIIMATNPFELFTEYGMRIKARSPFEQTFIVQLANDIAGYLPTYDAMRGGSYGSMAASIICGPESGDILVEKTLSAICELW